MAAEQFLSLTYSVTVAELVSVEVDWLPPS